MSVDEQAIRKLIDDWLQASAGGDLDSILQLMDKEIVFLTPGRPPMCGREEFAAMSRSMQGKIRLLQGVAEIQEIRVLGDFAWCWNFLRLTLTVAEGSPTEKSGHVLSIFRRGSDGAWRLYRDANLL